MGQFSVSGNTQGTPSVITSFVLWNLIPIRIKNDNCVASPCRAAALSAASRLVLLSNANWNQTGADRACTLAA